MSSETTPRYPCVALMQMIQPHRMRVLTEWVTNQVTNVLQQMLTDRGYSSIELLGGHETFATGGMIMRASVPRIYEVICIPEKIGVKTLRSIEEEYKQRSVLVVTLHKPAPPCLRQLAKEVSWCSVYDIGFLVRNVTRHKMVPKHEIVDKQEISEVCKRWRIDNLRRLPVILLKDPVVRYLGAVVGDVIKVSGSEGTQVGGGLRYCLVCKN